MTRPNLKKVNDTFSPDENGCSDWRTIQEVTDAGLNWSENGNVRRGIAFGVAEYLWEYWRIKGPKSKLFARTSGRSYLSKLDLLLHLIVLSLLHRVIKRLIIVGVVKIIQTMIISTILRSKLSTILCFSLIPTTNINVNVVRNAQQLMSALMVNSTQLVLVVL